MMYGWQNPSNAADWRTHIPSLAFARCNVSKACSEIPALACYPRSTGKKTICGTCGTTYRSWYDRRRRRVRDLSCADHRIYLDLEVRRVDCRQCGAVKRERLDFLVENALHTKRFALYVGRRCRTGTIRDVAEELHLDWQTVKRLEMDYMREQIRRVGTPGPKVIGIDEISIRKGHTYRIVVSDLERRRPIWFGGEDRSEASMDQFYRFLGKKKAKAHPPRRHGHVEGVSQLHAHERAAGRHPVRQVPRDEAPRRSARQDSQGRVRAPRAASSVSSSKGRNTRSCRTRKTSPARPART